MRMQLEGLQVQGAVFAVEQLRMLVKLVRSDDDLRQGAGKRDSGSNLSFRLR
jgi:hypothetical protein